MMRQQFGRMKRSQSRGGSLDKVSPCAEYAAPHPMSGKYRNSFEVPERKGLVIDLQFGQGTSYKAMNEDAVCNWTIMVSRLDTARTAFFEVVEVNPLVRGGVPVIRGTRIPLATVVACVSSDMKLSDIAEDFDLDMDTLRKVFESLATVFDRPANEYHSIRRMHKFEEVADSMHAGGADSALGISKNVGWESD